MLILAPVRGATVRLESFLRGAALADPSGLFSASVDGNTRRAIDFHEGEKVDEEAGKTEVRIYDYVDREVPMLARMFEKRLRGYRAIGYVHGPARVSREGLEADLRESVGTAATLE